MKEDLGPDTVINEIKIQPKVIVGKKPEKQRDILPGVTNIIAVASGKGISMFRSEKINVPVLGLVENMSWFTPAELPQNKYYKI